MGMGLKTCWQAASSTLHLYLYCIALPHLQPIPACHASTLSPCLVLHLPLEQLTVRTSLGECRKQHTVQQIVVVGGRQWSAQLNKKEAKQVGSWHTFSLPDKFKGNRLQVSSHRKESSPLLTGSFLLPSSTEVSGKKVTLLSPERCLRVAFASCNVNEEKFLTGLKTMTRSKVKVSQAQAKAKGGFLQCAKSNLKNAELPVKYSGLPPCWWQCWVQSWAVMNIQITDTSPPVNLLIVFWETLSNLVFAISES